LHQFCALPAEEAFLAHNRDDKDSIHLHRFPKVPKAWRNEALKQKWDEIRAIRRVVTGAMELARHEKKIGSSLQAHPHIYLKPEQKFLLESVDFSEISISSSVKLVTDVIPPEAFKIADIPDVGVVITLAEGQKCERCWQVLPEVGRQGDQVGLCCRCHDAVTHQLKGAA
jgi:isoleucyl-tRNA synthetase